MVFASLGASQVLEVLPGNRVALGILEDTIAMLPPAPEGKWVWPESRLTYANGAVAEAMMVAGYTAFLFGQAEGRDLWQSPVLFWHLQAQAVMVGAGVLLIIGTVLAPGEGTMGWLAWALIAGVVAHLLITAVEFGGNHPTRNAQVAAHAITHGRYRGMFWGGSIALSVLGALIALPVALGGPVILAVLAGLIVQVALVAHERVYVMAAQDPPLS